MSHPSARQVGRDSVGSDQREREREREREGGGGGGARGEVLIHSERHVIRY